MSVEYPYPTPFEILRFVLRALDLKQSNKRLDELVAKRIYDPRELHYVVENHFSKNTEKYMGKVTSEVMTECMNQFFDNYMRVVAGEIIADGVSREAALKILLKTCFKDYVIKLAQDIYEKVGGPHPSMWFSYSESGVKTALEWLDDNMPVWKQYVSRLSKERRDMVANWKKGKELPSAQSILLLSEYDASGESNGLTLKWHQIKTFIFISRLVDFAKRTSFGSLALDECRLALWGADNQMAISDEIKSMQRNLQKKFGSDLPTVAKLQHELMPTARKRDPDIYREIIDHIRELTLSSEQFCSLHYWVDWYDARWHVYSGDLQNANELYKKAFDDALFRSGINQKYITEEALVIAAIQPKPDRIFIKKLKWALISFRYDIASVTSNRPSNKAEDVIEEWELDIWKSNFNRVFPETGMFPGVTYNISQAAIGPLIITDPSKIKPDYRNPDRKIKIGETWQRVMPQLVWFSRIGNTEVCDKLIAKGATVNCSSEVGETPILFAIEALNIMAVPWVSLDDSLFKLIGKEEHKPEIINMRTQKRRLLPIISAVETGRLDLVKKVLKMDADPNKRGLTDEQTALNVCIKMIGLIKNPDKFWRNQNSMPITPEVLDSRRRYSAGLSGFTLEQQLQSLVQTYNNPLFWESLPSYQKLMTERVLSETCINTMREIAKLLIQSGSDVNAEHSSPVKGYTPLMLAAELDEGDIFDAMLSAGGDIKKTYKHPETGRDISVSYIANSFQSRDVKKILANA